MQLIEFGHHLGEKMDAHSGEFDGKSRTDSGYLWSRIAFRESPEEAVSVSDRDSRESPVLWISAHPDRRKQ